MQAEQAGTRERPPRQTQLRARPPTQQECCLMLPTRAPGARLQQSGARHRPLTGASSWLPAPPSSSCCCLAVNASHGCWAESTPSSAAEPLTSSPTSRPGHGDSHNTETATHDGHLADQLVNGYEVLQLQGLHTQPPSVGPLVAPAPQLTPSPGHASPSPKLPPQRHHCRINAKDGTGAPTRCCPSAPSFRPVQPSPFC